jgi:hypothetical protein
MKADLEFDLVLSVLSEAASFFPYRIVKTILGVPWNHQTIDESQVW